MSSIRSSARADKGLLLTTVNKGQREAAAAVTRESFKYPAQRKGFTGHYPNTKRQVRFPI